MSRTARFATRLALPAAIAAAVMASACTPISTFSGFQAVEQNPADVKLAEDTKSTVMTKLGSPTIKSTFDPNVWFYMSQVSDRVSFLKPQVMRRDITAIAFDKDTDKVTAVNQYSLKDGKVIAFNERETPTRGREMTVLEQLLGSVGNGGMLPRDDSENYPGGRPGDQ